MNNSSKNNDLGFLFKIIIPLVGIGILYSMNKSPNFSVAKLWMLYLPLAGVTALLLAGIRRLSAAEEQKFSKTKRSLLKVRTLSTSAYIVTVTVFGAVSLRILDFAGGMQDEEGLNWWIIFAAIVILSPVISLIINYLILNNSNE
ncbi:MAG: hypothetical protein II018_04455 [Firmicutes bacterium]|nr:hypothetical protein [Bacillota bacterium]